MAMAMGEWFWLKSTARMFFFRHKVFLFLMYEKLRCIIPILIDVGMAWVGHICFSFAFFLIKQNNIFFKKSPKSNRILLLLLIN